MNHEMVAVRRPHGLNRRLGLEATRLWRNRWLLFLLLPGFLYFVLFKYVPIYGILIAFKDFSLRAGVLGSRWVGLRHFISFFSYPYFFRLLRNTFLLNLYGLIWGFPLPIIFAVFLNEIRFLPVKKAVQTISYLPHFLSTVAVVGLLTMILTPRNGIINRLIGMMGGEPIYFMADSAWFRTLFIGSGIWQNLGWEAIIYLAAITGISIELYEAAYTDGASRFQQILHITIPGLLPTITILFLLRTGTLLSSSTEKVLLMQVPITYDVSDVIGTYTYRRGLIRADFSFGTAVGFFNSVINVALLLISNRIVRALGSEGIW